MNALQVYDEGRFDIMQRTSQAMLASGYFKDSRDLSQMLVKVMAGAELGLPPFASVVGINIIQGKPALGASVMATLVKNDPRYNYKVKVCDDKKAVLVWYEDGEMVGESSFTIDEAKTAGLASKDNWKKYPSDMLFARAISRGTRRFAPGIFGGAPVYTNEELGADEDGFVVEGSYEPVESTPEVIKPEAEVAEEAKPTLPEKTRKALHATATDLYGPAWDRKRAALCEYEGIESSNDLTEEQAQHYIELFGKRLDKINGDPAEMLKHFADLVGDKDAAEKLLIENKGDMKDLLKAANTLYEDSQSEGGEASEN